MGFLDGLLGRRKPTGPNLDALFAIPSAAITLETALDLVPTGIASIAFRSPEGRAFADVEAEVRALLDADGGPPVELSTDSFGYTWLVVRTDPVDIATAVTDAHAVNTTLVDHGFGPQLLCSLFTFTGPGNDGAGDRHLALVYLYKRGTFYPFAPTGSEQRDNVYELQIRDRLKGELPLEQDLTRWFPLWDAPGL